MFNYGSFKLFLFKVSIGALFVLFSSFLLLSFISYSPNDPGFGKFNLNVKIENYFGFFGAIASSFMVVVLGTSSVVIPLYIFYVGIFFALGKKTRFIFTKFFLIILTVVIFNFSINIQGIAVLQTGLLSKIILDISYFYFPFLEITFLYRLLIGIFSFIISFFSLMFSFSLGLGFLKNFLFKFFYFVFKNISKPLRLFRMPKVSKPNTLFKKNIIKNEPTLSKKIGIIYNKQI